MESIKVDLNACYRLKFNQTPETLYGWPKTQIALPVLSLLLLAFSPIAAASSGSTSTLAEKALIPITLLLLAQVAIPALRHLWNDRSQKKAFIAYMGANVESTLERYGHEKSIESLLENELSECAQLPFWVERLQKERDTAPVLLLQMQLALEEAVTQDAHTRGYIPFLSYSSLTTGELDHNHPIWSMEKHVAKLISDYLVSQAQIETSLKEQYGTPFYSLIKSDSYEQRHQWCAAGFIILDDLADHYLNTLALKRYLDGLAES